MRLNNTVDKLAFDEVTNRQLFSLKLSEPSELPSFDLGSPHFGCLIAWDAGQAMVDEVSALIDPLIRAGCVYFVCWGPSCELVHDVIDESVRFGESVIMTTWHSDESLEEAIWYFLNVTWPDKEFEKTLNASLAISVGSEEWASELRTALSNPRAFSRKVLDKEDRTE